MSADSRQESFAEKLVRLAVLMADAVIVVNKGSRSEGMIGSLLKALQLFKENRLGEVLPEMLKSETKTPPSSRLARREEFKKRLENLGLAVITSEFYSKLPTVARNALCDHSRAPRFSLAQIVLGEKHYWGADLRRGIGKISRAKIEGVLDEWGLYIGMSVDEVVECLGTIPPPERDFPYWGLTKIQQEFESLVAGITLTPEEKSSLASTYDHTLHEHYQQPHVPRWEGGEIHRRAMWKLAGKTAPVRQEG